MIIKKLTYKTYGRLADCYIPLEPGLNVIYGENEAGKSTVFSSINTLLFGFKPVSREKHPYVHWEKSEIHFSAEIMENMELFNVERSLRSVPKCVMTHLDKKESQVYKNETLPFVENISEALFESVFYLTSEDLNKIKNESWESIQSKLIFSFGSDYLHKTTDVLQKLDDDINGLWRNDKKGNPTINRLQLETSQLRLKKYEADKRQAKVRTLIDANEALSQTIRDAEFNRQSKMRKLKLLREVMPIIELKARMTKLKGEIFRPEEGSVLDMSFLNDIKTLETDAVHIEENLKKLDLERLSLEKQLHDFSQKEQQILSFRRDALSAQTLLNRLNVCEQEEHVKMEDFIKHRDKTESLFKLLFTEEMTENSKDVLLKMPVMDITTQVQKTIEKKQHSESEKLKNKHKRVLQMGVALGTSAVAILVLLLAVLLHSKLWVYLVSVVSTGMSVFMWTQFTGTIKAHKSECEIRARDEQHILDILAAYPIKFPDSILQDERLRFFTKLEQLILSIIDDEQMHERWVERVEQRNIVEDELSTLLKAHGFDTSLGVKLKLQYLFSSADALTDQVKQNEQLQFKIQSLEAQIDSLRSDLENIHVTLQLKKQQVTQFGFGDYAQGYHGIEKNEALRNKINIFEEELSDLSQGYTPPEDFEMEDELGLEYDISGLEESINASKELINQNKTDLIRLNEQQSVDEIEDEILNLEEQIEEATKKRDQWMILREIIKFSDERFRIQNQPNIIHRVSEYMRDITSGKYKEVILHQSNGQFELQFLMDSETISSSKAFSKGTLQQLFFAYRLAVLEVLDPKGNLPLLLDETFVNWDAKRFKQTLEILKKVSNQRQVLFFTCHAFLVDQISQHVQANVVEVME